MTAEKTLVYFHGIEWQVAKLTEAGGAGTEIVHRQACTQSTQSRQGGSKIRIAGDGAFGYFQSQRARWHLVLLYCLRQQFLEPGIAQLAARKIDAGKQRR